jgi:hypothetical protein
MAMKSSCDQARDRWSARAPATLQVPPTRGGGVQQMRQYALLNARRFAGIAKQTRRYQQPGGPHSSDSSA